MRQKKWGAAGACGSVLFGGLMLLTIWIHGNTGTHIKIVFSVLVLPLALGAGLWYRQVVFHTFSRSSENPLQSYSALALIATVAIWYLAGDLASLWPLTQDDATDRGSFFLWFFLISGALTLLMSGVAGFLQGQGFLRDE